RDRREHSAAPRERATLVREERARRDEEQPERAEDQLGLAGDERARRTHQALEPGIVGTERGAVARDALEEEERIPGSEHAVQEPRGRDRGDEARRRGRARVAAPGGIPRAERGDDGDRGPGLVARGARGAEGERAEDPHPSATSNRGRTEHGE